MEDLKKKMSADMNDKEIVFSLSLIHILKQLRQLPMQCAVAGQDYKIRNVRLVRLSSSEQRGWVRPVSYTHLDVYKRQPGI